MAKKYCFIIGAGASAEFKLPLGSTLKTSIGAALRLEDNGYSHYIVDRDLDLAIKKAQPNNYTPNQWESLCQQACSLISNGLKYAYSIDDFMYSHKDNVAVQICAKLAIAKIISEAENRSNLNNIKKHPSNEVTWLDRLVPILTDSCTFDNLVSRFENISMIIFNYDRCVEKFLYDAIKTKYGKNDGEEPEILKIINTIKILHPYGYLGELFPTYGPNTIPFGEKSSDRNSPYQALANNLTTINPEGAESKETLHTYKELTNNADCLVFVGFSFNTYNMEILSRGNVSSMYSNDNKECILTSFDQSESNLLKLKEIISSKFGVTKENIHYNVKDGQKACDLFKCFSSFFTL